MPGERREKRGGDAPSTDLPPRREPYYPGYFGTEEEEGVVREQDDREVEKEPATPPGPPGSDRQAGRP